MGRFDAGLYMPIAAPAEQAARSAVSAAGDGTPTASGGARVGLGISADPTIWILVLLLAWVGIVHVGFGVSAEVGIGG